MAIDYNSQSMAIIDSNHTTKEKIALLNEARKALSPDENRWNFRFVVWTICLIGLTLPALAVYKVLFTNTTVNIPTELVTLSSTALGALAAYLTPSMRRKDTDAAQATTAAQPVKPTKPAVQDTNTVATDSVKGNNS